MAQCIAEMVGAQRFNEKHAEPLATIFGVTTSGTAWRFLKLTEKTVEIDMADYYIADVEKIVGILCQMVRTAQQEKKARS